MMSVLDPHEEQEFSFPAMNSRMGGHFFESGRAQRFRRPGVTILIAASTSEGLVLAADSRTIRRSGAEGQSRLTIATNRARKVFPLSGRVGAATHGSSQLRGQTIASLADRFRWGRSPSASQGVTAVAGEFSTFLRRLWGRHRGDASKDTPPDPVGFFVAGYDGRGPGKLYEIQLPKGEPKLLSTTEAPNYHWRGQGDAISRLMKGCDPGFDRTRLQPEVTEMLRGLEYAVVLRHMSLQDAIDFVRLLAKVAIGIDRFTSGTLGGRPRDQVVGGRLRIAAVTPHGFQWVPRHSHIE
ncbi:MAG TPA: hypothetical protein VJN62_09385 [Gemmatimonadales bacterium]|nr:hypothetical protein [Gemmatimonadales bacterium]